MLISGWDIDLSKITTNRSRTHNALEYMFESPKGDFAALLYDVFEYRMGVEWGQLAVFKDKARPHLLGAPKIRWFASPRAIAWVTSTEFVVCTMRSKEIPIVIFDVAVERFSFIHVPRGDLYDVRFDGDTITLAPKRFIDASLTHFHRNRQGLQWFSMVRLADFDEAYLESASAIEVPHPSLAERAAEIAHWTFGGVMYLFLLLIIWPLLALDWIKARSTRSGVDD